MKKSISILLVVFFLFNAGGGYYLFRIFQTRIRWEVAGEIRKAKDERERVTLVFPLDFQKGIMWIRPGREFAYKGQLYDVISSATRDQHKYYYCYNDTKEKQLIAGFHKSHTSKKETEKRRKTQYNQKYLPQRPVLAFAFPFADFIYTGFGFHYISQVLITPSPPPKIS